MAEYGELYLPPVLEAPKAARKRQNPNKGRKWDEWMPKRAQKKIRKALARIADHRRGKPNPLGGQNKRKVIAVLDDGTWTCFSSMVNAARLVGVPAAYISNTCQRNRRGYISKKQLGQPCHDYRCRGVRFYYEDDNHWMERIRQ